MTTQKISIYIEKGYERIKRHDSIGACENWLKAWAGLKTHMDENGIINIYEIKDNNYYVGYMIPGNMVRDMGWELLNAGLEDEKYNNICIEFGNDVLNYLGDDSEAKEEIRRSIAESYFAIGDEEEYDRLYNGWIDADPQWGWGYLEWALQYEDGRRGERDNLEKASKIYERVLEIYDVRDRIDVVERAINFYERTGDGEKVEKLRNELSILQAANPSYPKINPKTPITKNKTGRNDPCPCGSGKKYKNCCGAV